MIKHKLSITADKIAKSLNQLLPTSKVKKGRPRKSDQEVLFMILWVIKNGCPWRAIPKEYGCWQTAYARMRLWAKQGIWQSMLEQVNIDTHDDEYHMIDSTTIRVHQDAATTHAYREGIGQSAGGKTSKIHMKINALGDPLSFIVSPGNDHDRPYAEELIRDEPCEYLIADRGYDCNKLRSYLTHLHIKPIIPGKSNRKQALDYDRYIYKERNIIERLFRSIKTFRRVATRYDRLLSQYYTTITIALLALY